MSIWIKICGITGTEVALACARNNADAVGFVFTASRRKISIHTAACIAEILPQKMVKVGVFVDAPVRWVSDIQKHLGLDLLQFHGTESPQYCARFAVRAIKSFCINSLDDLHMVRAYRDSVWAVLLDSGQVGNYGGSGKTWDWSLVGSEQKHILSGIRVILSGGLNSDNIFTALDLIRPDGVDVSTGVENDGQKSISLIEEFIRKVRKWEDSVGSLHGFQNLDKN